jgi:phosphopantothenoylcysteine decarboxylase/phosphopantothenate--cysteine ligase
MATPFENKKILLGVTGSIAAYKAADLAAILYGAGAIVDTVMTENATHFISPLTFKTVTARPVYTDENFWGGENPTLHIELARTADLVLVAPATANTIAKLAHGIADNLLTVTLLAAQCPIVFAPAMDSVMYDHPATVENVRILEDRGVIFLGPTQGRLVSGWAGLGSMVEPAEILPQIRFMLSRKGHMAGMKILITAGSTQEPIDPVRTIVGRSVGRLGYAIAQAGLDNGADVVLISAPTALPTPYGVKKILVRTAHEMYSAVMSEIDGCYALVMAASVADFRPLHSSIQKIKKVTGISQIDLEPTVDILAEVAANQVKTGIPEHLIGFADETEDVISNALAKLEAKHLDMMVVNDVSGAETSFDSSNIKVSLLYSDGRIEEFPLLTKELVAENLIHRIETWSSEIK